MLQQPEEVKLSSELIKAMQSLNANDRKNHHIRITFCMGYKIFFTKEQFLSFITQLESLQVPYTIYLVPKNEDVLKQFVGVHGEAIEQLGKSSNNTVPAIGESIKAELLDIENKVHLSEEECDARKILLIDKWRNLSKWNHASLSFETYRGGRRKQAVDNCLYKNDIPAYHKKHPELSVDDIKEHYLLEAKDYISWFKRADLSSAQQKVNILVYNSKNLPSLLRHINQYALCIGLEPVEQNADELDKKTKNKQGKPDYVPNCVDGRYANSLPLYCYTFAPAKVPKQLVQPKSLEENQDNMKDNNNNNNQSLKTTAENALTTKQRRNSISSNHSAHSSYTSSDEATDSSCPDGSNNGNDGSHENSSIGSDIELIDNEEADDIIIAEQVQTQTAVTPTLSQSPLKERQLNTSTHSTVYSVLATNPAKLAQAREQAYMATKAVASGLTEGLLSNGMDPDKVAELVYTTMLKNARSVTFYGTPEERKNLENTPPVRLEM